MIFRKIVSLLLILAISPILLIVMPLIFFDDGFPIFFRQKRVGKNNKLFFIYKFRTMKLNTPNVATHLLKDGAYKYTFLGPFLRKYSIDELPQLFNLIKGDMAFIGPRPALHNQKDLVQLRTKVGVHKLLPGVTGWAQINGRDELSIKEKVDMDFFYLNNKSSLLDIKILFLTFIKVFKAEGVEN